MKNDSFSTNLPGALSIRFGGIDLQLLPDRAIWWPQRETLIVADVHLGKGAAFRKAGLPVPTGASRKDLGRLNSLLGNTGAHRLVILGDLIHAKASHQPQLLQAICRWRAELKSTEVLLIRGNHDRSAGHLPTECRIDEVEEPFDDAGIIFCHAPRTDLAGTFLAGHVHPIIYLPDFDRSSLRVACFIFDSDRCGILPAFGSFTGGHPMTRKPGRRFYITTGKRVVPVPVR